ncbi:hypothetical protein AJ79_03385 [Helicocarpus griseus UAMH5409]|uniref:Uncharacterized protein n=1 Tax=Helicocarpus griseus UAMH5409 TaxID=1447875 RepID=A0A2B7XZB9_9EURO|nr:hypothetical protein AJ79_03385 [Helicocarpus griseus UAMH5409]
MHFFGLLTLATAAGSAFAHIEMSQPPAFRSKFGPDKANADYSNTTPLLADDSSHIHPHRPQAHRHYTVTNKQQAPTSPARTTTKIQPLTLAQPTKLVRPPN